MDREEFAARVQRLERRAQRWPRWFGFSTALLAVLGYAYVLLVLVLMITVTVAVLVLVVLAPNLATIKIALGVGVVSGGLSCGILRSLWVRLSAPAGILLAPGSAPALLAVIDKLRRDLRAPKLHAVLFDGAFNASVTQTPRLGIFGWQKNYLCLGLPLLQALSPEEFTAVLAHEFGHLSGNHGRFSGWIYQSANSAPEPPGSIFVQLGQRLVEDPPEESVAAWLRTARQIPTSVQDTHPSLTDRLEAIRGIVDAAKSAPLGVEVLPPRSGSSAATHLLGPLETSLAETLSEQWRTGIMDDWKQRHARVQDLHKEFDQTVALPEANQQVDQLWKQASLLLELEGDAAGLPVINRILELDPGHAPANFIRGRHALARDDPDGIPFIEAAMRADLDSIPSGCNVLHAHYRRMGQTDRIRAVEARWDAHQHLMAEVARERADATVKDRYLPHELTPLQLEELRKVLINESDVGPVHLARKAVQHLPDRPLYVTAVYVRVSWWKPRSSSANQKLVARLVDTIRLPGQFLVFVAEERLRSLGKKIGRVPNALVYRRTKLTSTPPAD